jgi:hypothetical protein
MDRAPIGWRASPAETASASDWPAAFEQEGQASANLAKGDHLPKGLRAVLAQHVLFAWHRLGIPASDQQLLAACARTVVSMDCGGRRVG